MKFYFTITGVAAAVLLWLPGMRAHAEEGKLTLALRPHCESLVCPDFFDESPSTRKTIAHNKGDRIDMDLIILNPAQLPIHKIRAWLTYDPALLSGIELQANRDVFSLVSSDETGFFSEEGYVKFSAEREAGSSVNDPVIVAGRIQLLVESQAAPAGTAISFHNVQTGGSTEVLGPSDSGETESLLETDPSAIHVIFAEIQPQPVAQKPSIESMSSSSGTTPAQTVENSTQDSPAPLPTVAENAPALNDAEKLPVVTQINPFDSAAVGRQISTIPDNAFTKVQVQNLKVNTEGNAVHLLWKALPSDSLQAYNIYYGTVSGTYIQRRTIAGNNNSLILRGLPINTQYYFAIRAVSEKGDETSFSQEVAVIVGNPSTSTAPFSPAVTVHSVPQQVQNPLIGQLSEELIHVKVENAPMEQLNDAGFRSIPGKTGIPLQSILALLFVAGGIFVVFLMKQSTIRLSHPLP